MDVDQQDSRSPSPPPRAVLKAKQGKGKKFANESTMLELINTVNAVEESRIDRKLNRMAEVAKRDSNQQERTRARQKERRKALQDKKRELLERQKRRVRRPPGAAAPAAAADGMEGAADPQSKAPKKRKKDGKKVSFASGV
ncbi:hypothetical protein HK405_000433 [Cladochytrium tenue]|nr:hypothetical protein HK405_000433 [Cladochytrium tenue]